MESDQVCSTEDTNEYKWPEIYGKDENSRGVQFDSRALLKTILSSQCKTEEHLDAVPKERLMNC
jgi:hypothetical protein